MDRDGEPHTIIEIPHGMWPHIIHIHRPVFSRGEVDYLSGSEIAFWADLIEKYLYPLDADKAKQDAIAAGLRELRNKMVFFFSVFNALFVLIVFMLTLHKDTLHIDWPFGVKENITYTEDEQVGGCGWTWIVAHFIT